MKTATTSAPPGRGTAAPPNLSLGFLHALYVRNRCNGLDKATWRYAGIRRAPSAAIGQAVQRVELPQREMLQRRGKQHKSREHGAAALEGS